jgi:hypothetical protein
MREIEVVFGIKKVPPQSILLYPLGRNLRKDKVESN